MTRAVQGLGQTDSGFSFDSVLALAVFPPSWSLLKNMDRVMIPADVGRRVEGVARVFGGLTGTKKGMIEEAGGVKEYRARAEMCPKSE